MRRTLLFCRLPSTMLTVGLETLCSNFRDVGLSSRNSMLASLNNQPVGLGW